jgi:HlyD family secretion protein
MLNAGSTVLTLSLTRPVWVRAYISEVNLHQAQPGQTVLLYVDGRPNKPYHGKIGFVSPTAEFTPKTVETPDCVPIWSIGCALSSPTPMTHCARECRSP